MRASAAPVSTACVPDLQAFLATAYLLEKSRRPLTTEAGPAGSAHLFSTLVSLQRQAADLDVDMDEVLASMAQHVRALTRADAAAVALLEGDGVLCRARAGPMAPSIGTSVNLRSSFTGESFRTRQVLYCEDSEDDPRVNRSACRVAGIRSILVVPVERQSQSIGIVEVLSAWPARFGTSQIHVLKLMAGLLADAVRAREVVETPRSLEPAAPARQIDSAATTAPAVAEVALPPPEICDKVAANSEPATSEQEAESVVVRRPSRRIAVRALLVLSIILMSSATGVFLEHQRGPVRRVSTQPPPLVVTESVPASTIVPTAAPLQMVATGPGILLGVKYNSQAAFTSVAIELSGPVKVKAAHLNNPERIYFDLEDTHIATEFIDAMHMKAIAIGDRLVSRVRVAQKSEDVARVVIDLNRTCEFTNVMSESPPFRLVIELHAAAKATSIARAEPEKVTVATAPPVALPPSLPSTKLATPNRPLRIVIDPGHGGWDRGSVGPTGLLEKELVLDVAERLSKLLKARLGAETILTRADDTFVPLESRPALANRVGADLFLSIHGNSSSVNNVRGVETYYVTPAAYKGGAPGGPETAVTASRRLAAAVQHALYATLSGADPLVQDRGVKAAALSVLEAPIMPSVLTEISFVTSPYEEQKLRRPEYRETIAEALFKGIKAYAARGVQPRTQTATLQGK